MKLESVRLVWRCTWQLPFAQCGGMRADTVATLDCSYEAFLERRFVRTSRSARIRNPSKLAFYFLLLVVPFGQMRINICLGSYDMHGVG